MASVFFSYSHKDEALRNELEVHLAPLKRQGLIEAWHDRRIDAGEDFAGAIREQLEQAQVILLLVSPYFLNSDYCYDVEMARAMQRHEAGAARVIPVILDPCDWHAAPFGKLLAVPTDGKPISKYPNRHDAFLEVAQALRRAISTPGASSRSAPGRPVAASPPATIAPDIRSSNLRITKKFSDHDRDDFLDQTYEYLCNFFEGSLEELRKRNPEISSRFKRVDATRFTAFIYRDGTAVSECAVSLRGVFGSGITYASDSKSTNSYNESLSVANNGQSLYLKPLGFSGMSRDAERQLSQQGAAEYLWEILMRPLQT